MPTDTFPIAADADNGYGRELGVSWPVSSGDTFADAPFGTDIVSMARHANGGFYVMNGYLRFDTSSIPDTAVISAAALKMHVLDAASPDAGSTLAFDYYDFGGAPSVVADWELSSSGDAVSAFTISSLSIGSVNTIAITTLTGINVSGFTGFRFAPAQTTQPTGDNFADFASRQHATAQEPRLEVTYTVPATGASVAWIRA